MFLVCQSLHISSQSGKFLTSLFIPACENLNLFKTRTLIILYQQQQAVSYPNPLHQADPEYEEVMELSENVAYKPVQSIKMKENEAYQFVGQY